MSDIFASDSPIDSLTDEQVLLLCDMQMTDALQDELSDLLSQQREGQLNADEQEHLNQLMAVYRRGLIRKAEALKVAVERGLRPPLSE